MDGKAKNIDKTFLGSGGGVGRWSEVHGPRRHWEIFLFPYFKTYFTQICCRVIFRQQIKTFHSKMHVPKKESCIYSTVQKKCMCKKWRKKLLRHKNMQATARSESAVFLRILCDLPARTLKRKKSKIFTARSYKITASLKKAHEIIDKC